MADLRQPLIPQDESPSDDEGDDTAMLQQATLSQGENLNAASAMVATHSMTGCRQTFTSAPPPRLSHFYDVVQQVRIAPAVVAEQQVLMRTGSENNRSMMRSNQKKCKDLLLRLQQGGTLRSRDLEQLLDPLLFYKNRYVKGTLLHYAVWAEAERADQLAGCVRLVLEARAYLHSRAEYQGVGNRTVLEAVHIAAGLGCVPALDALWQAASNELQQEQVRRGRASEVSTPEVAKRLLDTWTYLGDEKYYTPLHEAAFLGKDASLLWLLEHGAHPQVFNRLGLTPLHFVAWRGHSSEKACEDMVIALLHAGRQHSESSHLLLDKVSAEGTLPMGLLPLEVATLPGSRYPRALLYLLAESFHSLEDTHSLFDDLFVVSEHSIKSAESLVKHILTSSRMEPQRVHLRKNKWNYDVSKMAKLIFLAPSAASDFLKILTVTPDVQDWSRQPISSRTRFGSGILNHMRQMRSDYQLDFEWKWDSTRTEDELPNSRYKKWHRKFMPEVPATARGKQLQGVYEVSVKVVLFPNLLHVDVFWALGRVNDQECTIFATIPVQGIVTCMWDNFVGHVYHIALFFNAVDLCAFIRLGLDEGGPYAPRYWTLVVAGALSTAAELSCRTMRYFSMAKDNPDLWSTSYYLGHTTFFFDLAYLFCQGWAIQELRPFFLDGGSSASLEEFEKVLRRVSNYALLITMMVAAGRFTYMLRLHDTVGRKIFALTRSFCSGAMVEMLLLLVLTFLTFFFSLWMLHRNDAHSGFWVFVVIYRAILGDGDGLDVGLKVNNDEEYVVDDDHGASALLMLIATFLFYVLILNLIVAVYENIYDEVEQVATLYFQRGRSKWSALYMLAFQNIGTQRKELVRRVQVAVGTCFVAGVLLLVFLQGEVDNFLHTVAAVFLAAARVGWLSLAMQRKALVETDALTMDRSKPSLGAGLNFAGASASDSKMYDDEVISDMSDDDHHYDGPWLALRKQTGHLSEVLRKGGIFNDWTARVKERRKSKKRPRFLWICHRAGYREDLYRGGERYRFIDDRIQEATLRLQNTLEAQHSEVEGKLQSMQDRIDSLGSIVTEKLDKMLAVSPSVDSPGGVRRFEA
mmetsp:Transcript_26499/g.61825  ORF Transcript_26499/g.61825 Transcript_26499/m.61825 type:complete len:1086 (-) Transcript_26499:149-3406(-)